MSKFNPGTANYVRTDARNKTCERCYPVIFNVPAAKAVAASAAGVMAATNLGAAVQTITTGITSPAAPRALSVVGNVSGITGNVVVTGTNYAKEVITETFALNGSTTVHGTKAFKTVTSVALPVQVHTPVAQVETATAAGTITVAGNAAVVVTAAGMTGSPKTISVPVVGTCQVETATVVGTIGAAGAGDAAVVVTAAGMTGSPVTLAVAVANNDTAAQVAGKIKTAMGLDACIAAFFTIGGSDAVITLTRKAATANDATMNVSIDNGTCTGLTAAPTSVNTTAGVVGDDASAIAGKIRTALAADAAVAAKFTVSGATDKVILTAKTPLANDATLNIAIADDTSVGVTTAASSANTTAGVPYDIVSVGWNDKLGLPYQLERNTVIPGMTFLNNVRESTEPTVTTSTTALESNTIDLHSALDGTVVDVYLVV